MKIVAFIIVCLSISMCHLTKAQGTNKTPDEIDWLVANLGSSYGGFTWGMVQSVHLPETASTEEVVSNISKRPSIDKALATYKILEIRQIRFPLISDPYTAVLVQTAVGRKIVLFRYEGKEIGWWYRAYDAKNSRSTESFGGDAIWRWIDFAFARDPKDHLAFVEIASIADERHKFTNAPNSQVSDDGGKTWYNLLNERSGLATLKVIESPGVQMPGTITVYFETRHYVPTRDTPWIDQVVKPGARLLGTFTLIDGKWVLEGSWFVNPLDYLSDTHYGSRLQKLFKTPLSDAKTFKGS